MSMEALLEVFYYNRYDNDISPLLIALDLVHIEELVLKCAFLELAEL
jgi:hypothetical protein